MILEEAAALNFVCNYDITLGGTEKYNGHTEILLQNIGLVG
jgi:hypothetical protein